MPELVHDTSKTQNLTHIEVLCKGDKIAEHDFPPGRVIIGRSPDNDIYIKSKFVSRHHAQLVTDESGCTIEDLNSTNGVFLDDVRVKRHKLSTGDIIQLGIHELVYADLRSQQEQEQSDDDEEDSVVSENQA